MKPHTFLIDNMQDDYTRLVHHVYCYGEDVSPRGLKTRELRAATVVLTDPTRALPVGIGRKLNVAFAAAEALQLVGEFSDATWLKRVNPNIDQFLDDGILYGGYGKRVEGQMSFVVKRLKGDPDTRQAQVVLWNPALDLVDGKHDYPCTTAIQFLIRKDKLECHVRMRSNDVWWGLAYDVFQFTQLQLSVCNALGIYPGVYVHQPVSLHLYNRDHEAVDQLHPHDGSSSFHPTGLGVQGGDSWWVVRNHARRIRHGMPIMDETLSEAWYRSQLERYVEVPDAAV